MFFFPLLAVLLAGVPASYKAEKELPIVNRGLAEAALMNDCRHLQSELVLTPLPKVRKVSKVRINTTAKAANTAGS